MAPKLNNNFYYDFKQGVIIVKNILTTIFISIEPNIPRIKLLPVKARIPAITTINFRYSLVALKNLGSSGM